MAKQIYRLTGKAAYVSRKFKVFQNSPKPVYTMSFYPEGAAGRKAIKDTGIKNHAKEDDGLKSGVEGFFYTLRSNEEYAILDKNGIPLDENVMVGNGSTVTVELEVETFTSKQHGPQARSKLLAVTIDELVPYIPKEATVTDVTAELPA